MKIVISAIVDAAMNDLIRPSLYSAWMNIVPVNVHCHVLRNAMMWSARLRNRRFPGKDRELAIAPGDYSMFALLARMVSRWRL